MELGGFLAVSNRQPVVVLGSGRAGSSHTTRLLHTRLGIEMGDTRHIANNWLPEKWRTTKGNWERASTRLALYAVLNVKALTPIVVIETIEELASIYGDRPWGFKHPHFCYLAETLAEYLPDAMYIENWRPAKDVAKSMVKCYNNPNQTYNDYFKQTLKRQKMCQILEGRVENFMRIKLSEYIEEGGEENVLRRMSEFTGQPILDTPISYPDELSPLKNAHPLDRTKKVK